MDCTVRIITFLTANASCKDPFSHSSILYEERLKMHEMGGAAALQS
jgi:hypothetical protein